MKKLTSRFGSKQRVLPTDGQVDQPDHPEANALRGIKSFCEAGGTGANPGEEVLHLPVIVEAAESSPQAAAVAAQEIRRLLGKENFGRPYVQYNCIMLIRILANNPGQTFTKNLDAKFATTVKELLRTCRDPSVQQIMRETLDALEAEKAYDENLITIMAMWRKEKGAPEKGGYAQYQITQARNMAALNPWYRPGAGQAANWRVAEASQPTTLPSPEELAGRVEEGKTTAKILIQLIQSTPPAEVTTNELIKEFSQRGVVATRSLQGYMHCNPPPDADTLQTLIETCEQLNLASSKHQRAILQARRAAAPSPLAGQPGQFANAGPGQVAAGAQSAPLQAPADFRIPQPQHSIASTAVQRSTSLRQAQNPLYAPSDRQSQPSPLLSYADTADSRSPHMPPSPATPPRPNPAAPASRYNSAYSPPPGPPGRIDTQQDTTQGRSPSPSSQITRPSTLRDDDLYSDGDVSTNLYDTSPVRNRPIIPKADPDTIDSPSDYYRGANPFSNANTIPESAPTRSLSSANPYSYTHPAHRSTLSTTSMTADPPTPTQQRPALPSIPTDPFFTQPTTMPSTSADSTIPSLLPQQLKPQSQSQSQPQPKPYHNPALAPRDSYISRQEDAVGGLMMSGAGSPPTVGSPPNAGAKEQKSSGWRHRKWDA